MVGLLQRSACERRTGLEYLKGIMNSTPNPARVLLVSANREDINMVTWPLGVVSVAAATSMAGHDVRLLDLMQTSDPYLAVEQTIRDFQPEVIGISVRNIDDQSMLDTKLFLDQVKSIVSHCKGLSTAPVVLGGAGYSIYPDSALKYLAGDMGIQGEGESVFPQLADRIKSGADLTDLPGLHLPGIAPTGSRAFVRNLDEFPLPDVNLISPEAYGREDFWMPVQTRRGCPMQCSYCSTPAIEGLSLRKRTPEAVVHWLKTFVAAGILQFFFVDNTFNLPGFYAMKLCSLIERANLKITWRSILYPAKMNEELVELMARTGCAEVSLGFESGYEPILRSMNKRFSLDNVRSSARMLTRHGIRTMGFLMLGGPGETLNSAEESLRFADSLNLDCVKITMGIRIYPDTALARQAIEDGIVSADDDLLFPRFYMVPGLGEPLRQLVERWMSQRPNWLM
jgi:radical SAM superfamily enzyme YgiQ (UPF0313 family)